MGAGDALLMRSGVHSRFSPSLGADSGATVSVFPSRTLDCLLHDYNCTYKQSPNNRDEDDDQSHPSPFSGGFHVSDAHGFGLVPSRPIPMKLRSIEHPVYEISPVGMERRPCGREPVSDRYRFGQREPQCYMAFGPLHCTESYLASLVIGLESLWNMTTSP